jgi:RimJ/RimL family protein N-acetyltransferase
MISLTHNDPENLSIQISGMWITPFYQNKNISHEAMLLLLQWLFREKYRRVTIESDARHVIYRKFLEKCGFKLDGILKKHKIVRNRNKDTALYCVLNSDFEQVELNLKKLLGLPIRPPNKKVKKIVLYVIIIVFYYFCSLLMFPNFI